MASVSLPSIRGPSKPRRKKATNVDYRHFRFHNKTAFDERFNVIKYTRTKPSYNATVMRDDQPIDPVKSRSTSTIPFKRGDRLVLQDGRQDCNPHIFVSMLPFSLHWLLSPSPTVWPAPSILVSLLLNIDKAESLLNCETRSSCSTLQHWNLSVHRPTTQ
jgi:hypothetical protein